MVLLPVKDFRGVTGYLSQVGDGVNPVVSATQNLCKVGVVVGVSDTSCRVLPAHYLFTNPDQS